MRRDPYQVRATVRVWCAQAQHPLCPAGPYKRCDHHKPCPICGEPSMLAAGLLAYWQCRCEHGYAMRGGKMMTHAEAEAFDASY